MQQELTDLQPQLIKTSAETEQLMQKIEVDTTEVEAKKEVCLSSLCFVCSYVHVRCCLYWVVQKNGATLHFPKYLENY